jgi:hypothetical protein
LLYTLQAGLNLYQPVNVPGYPVPTYTYGLRNITGEDQGDGSVTILFALSVGFWDHADDDFGGLRGQRRLSVEHEAGARKQVNSSKQMPPAIRPDIGSSEREVVLLLRSLLELFAGRGRFVTGFIDERPPLLFDTALSPRCESP